MLRTRIPLSFRYEDDNEFDGVPVSEGAVKKLIKRHPGGSVLIASNSLPLLSARVWALGDIGPSMTADELKKKNPNWLPPSLIND